MNIKKYGISMRLSSPTIDRSATKAYQMLQYRIPKNSDMYCGEFRPYEASNRYLTLSKVDRILDRVT